MKRWLVTGIQWNKPTPMIGGGILFVYRFGLNHEHSMGHPPTITAAIGKEVTQIALWDGEPSIAPRFHLLVPSREVDPDQVRAIYEVLET